MKIAEVPDDVRAWWATLNDGTGTDFRPLNSLASLTTAQLDAAPEGAVVAFLPPIEREVAAGERWVKRFGEWDPVGYAPAIETRAGDVKATRFVIHYMGDPSRRWPSC